MFMFRMYVYVFSFLLFKDYIKGRVFDDFVVFIDD